MYQQLQRYQQLLTNNIRYGILNLHLPGGESYRFGSQGKEVHWIIKQSDVLPRIAKDWEFQLGETYISGGWDVKESKLLDLLAVLRINFSDPVINKWLLPLAKLRQQWNRIAQSYRNVSHHYNQQENLFRIILDKNMHYSCAYFSQDELTLEQAQQEKCRHIAKKLLLKPGQRVLDIGCGFGSLAFSLASYADIEIVGLTLSKLQLELARREARQQGIKNVRFELMDYRQHQGLYDRIVSVGMFEHVGQPFYNTYFHQLSKLLKNDGVALIHTIGRSGPPTIVNPWIRKYIFPGGGIPSLSEISKSIEESRLMITDVEIMRLHYARTLNAWLQRLQSKRDQVTAMLGEKSYRMWEFYYAISEIAFLHSDLVVFQIQLAKQHNIVPITRDYLYAP
jgi:cyclopropane-fatty-acyl-phospholipid synthase